MKENNVNCNKSCDDDVCEKDINAVNNIKDAGNEINEGSFSLLTGNEAIARAAFEAGVKVATAYPGTPSTEILENISKYKEIYSQWSVNEKVALEVASGASIAGARALVAMKHVGLNVAADPFMTLAYTGVNGGLVIVAADDPGMHSSQNEQDSRYYARFARIPMFEPSDSQEALNMVKAAFEISEKFDTPVLVRTTTRISHSRSVVKTGIRQEIEKTKYIKDARKYVMIPAYARIRHKLLLERWEKLKELVEGRIFWSIGTAKIDKAKSGNKPGYNYIGIITSGVSYQYASEVFSHIPIFKLNMTNPIPEGAIRDFAKNKKFLLIIEELEPFLEEKIRLLGLSVKVEGKEYFPETGELGLDAMIKAYDRLCADGYLHACKNHLENHSDNKYSGAKISNSGLDKASANDEGAKERQIDFKNDLRSLPSRSPVLCAGCPHRPVFHVLKKLKVTVMGDIGCYTLSVLPPLNAIDSCLCMGAGIGQALGAEKANPGMRGRLASVIGDSTFFHSGITPLIDNAYNKGTGLIIILDNRTTAMTGHQFHPGTGRTLSGEETVEIKPENIAGAAGIKNISIVDPFKYKELEETIKKELNKSELSVVVCRGKCILLEKSKKTEKVIIDQDKCKKCGLCLQFGCPAIEFRDGIYEINQLSCRSCKVCLEICKSRAIKSLRS